MSFDSRKIGSLTTLAAIATVTCAFALAPASAQTKQARYYRSYGTSEAGGSIDLLARGQHYRYSYDGGANWAKRSTALARGRATASIFGRTVEAAYGELSATANDGAFVRNLWSRSSGWIYLPSKTGSTRMFGRLGGFTVVNRTTSSTDVLGFDVELNVLNESKTILVGNVVPVTVNVRAGAGIAFFAETTVQPQENLARVGGTVRPYGTGSASVGVGIDGAQAGVEAQLQFAKTNFNSYVQASPVDVGGYKRISIEAIDLRLNLFVELLWSRWRLELFRYQSGEIPLRTYQLM